MDSLTGAGLRASSAVAASTSSSTFFAPKTFARFKNPSTLDRKLSFGKDVGTTSSPSQRSQLPKVYAGVQEISKVNGSKVKGGKGEGSVVGSTMIEEVEQAVVDVERTSGGEMSCESNPTFNAVLKVIASVALAADKHRRHEQLAGKVEVPVDALRQGRLVESGRVYRQTFVIRSYEVGVDKTASIDTLMNHFQETALNHVWMSGLAGDGFGATHAMIRSNLIWVVTRMQVKIERYPTWGDVVEIDTWVLASGKNGMRRDWLIRDYKSGQILARATSTWVMMNQKTRRLSKMPDEVRTEISPHYLERSAILEKNSQKIVRLDDEAAEYIRSGLTPRRGDLDMNQHVNNVKYIGWMLESLPAPILEGHELTNMTLEYRRECNQSDVVQSMTSPESPSSSLSGASPDTQFSYSPGTLALTPEMTNSAASIGPLQYTHLLRLQVDGSEIVRGRTIWRLKQYRHSHSHDHEQQ
ncbi:fatty acyl-ACP thioesterase B [Marchantia polymorpha subsp. ruderalis]|uniref:Acyl-[acyl-carrier-protein] hydrolase n=1 Tax=Marchantia polymorpha TaxID=3197 RepID=A0A2R6XC91_MARPO|nr:hypothetical protein MARPO_0023s0056 [Marchantia polymorpha]BBN01864.1 hypothetical protein Mp_2g10900 [Marchantia polymorpha subsp. ruderalis]|eukprot:PTQ43726.1 hypothetical protein MARPO_0023s0056 [Marchantia polymorpha]